METIKRIQIIIYEIMRIIFAYILIVYFLSLVLDLLIPNFVSNYINLDYFILLIGLPGILILLLNPRKDIK